MKFLNKAFLNNLIRDKEFFKMLLTAVVLIAVVVLLLVWAFGGSTQAGKGSYKMDPAEYDANPGIPTIEWNDSLQPVAVTPENLTQYLNSFSIPNDAYWVMSHYDEINQVRYSCNYRIKDGRERVECYREGKLYYYYIFAPESTIKYESATDKRETIYLEQYDALSYAYMQFYNELLNLKQEDIITVSYSSLLNQNMLYVEYGDADATYHKCWISLKGGIPIVCETYVDGVKTEHTTTNSYTIDVADPIIFK